MSRIIVTTAPIMSGVSQNGIATVMENTSRSDKAPRVLITGDSTNGEYFGVPVIGVGAAYSNTQIRQRWHNLGYWQLLHEDAFTRPILSDKALQGLWASAAFPYGERTHLREIVDFFTSDLSIECEALERYRKPLELHAQEGDVISFQDFACGQIVRIMSETLQRRGCSIELTHHTALSDHLGHSKTGRELIEAYALADKIYVHIEEYRNALKRCLPSTARASVHTFSCGIHRAKLTAAAQTILANNFTETIPGYRNLSQDQQAFVSEVLKSEGLIPHRFISIDRIDAVKGNLVVFDAVRQFLEETGQSLEQLRESYRFFFLYTARASALEGEPALWTRYSRFAEQELAVLVHDYPGVVWSSWGLEGPTSLAMGALLRNQTTMSGGAHDGLNLSVMESAFVNRGNPESIILGRGAGWAKIVCAQNDSDLAFFPKAGDVGEFKQSIAEVCDLKKRNPDSLSERTVALVDKHVTTRGDAVV